MSMSNMNPERRNAYRGCSTSAIGSSPYESSDDPTSLSHIMANKKIIRYKGHITERPRKGSRAR